MKIEWMFMSFVFAAPSEQTITPNLYFNRNGIVFSRRAVYFDCLIWSIISVWSVQLHYLFVIFPLAWFR